MDKQEIKKWIKGSWRVGLVLLIILCLLGFISWAIGAEKVFTTIIQITIGYGLIFLILVVLERERIPFGGQWQSEEDFIKEIYGEDENDGKERTKINNLAVAEFRKFCKSNGFNFYFPDEHKNKFNPELFRQESKLISEALNLFNKTNPRIYTSENVTDFYLGLDGIYSYKVYTATNLIIENDKLTTELNLLKKQYKVFAILGIISFLIILLWLFNKIRSYLDPLNQYQGWQSILILMLILGAIMSEFFVEKIVQRFELRKREKDALKFGNSIVELKNKLTTVQNNGEKN